mmetsp:Transcript_14137/g.15364  ORF Transcript_14137/g.15364 Transcript_14137/m.15364 type:complete len:157 (+) Transcript_14137:146-616(+)
MYRSTIWCTLSVRRQRVCTFPRLDRFSMGLSSSVVTTRSIAAEDTTAVSVSFQRGRRGGRKRTQTKSKADVGIYTTAGSSAAKEEGEQEGNDCYATITTTTIPSKETTDHGRIEEEEALHSQGSQEEEECEESSSISSSSSNSGEKEADENRHRYL